MLCADIQLEEGVLLKELDIRCQLKNKLQDFKIPRRIKFVESFAFNKNRKIKKIMNYLVTGCSRGVGLEICRVLLEQGHTVYGVARSYTDEFKKTGVRV